MSAGGGQPGPYRCVSPGCDVGHGAGVDSVGFYAGMGGVCRTFAGATLLAVTGGQLVL